MTYQPDATLDAIRDDVQAIVDTTADPTIQTLAAAIEALLRIAGAQDEEPAA